MRTLLTVLLLVAGAAPAAPPALPSGAQTAIFAGGCFWCTESDFEKLPGVLAAESGYIGGQVPNPTYEQVSAGGTGHTEAVRVTFDPAKVSYGELVERFWRDIDPTVADRQFCDHGSQYRSGIFYQGPEQERIARASKAALEQSGRFKRIHTEVTAAGPFYPAEEDHQDYSKKNPLRYQLYRKGCGRDRRLEELWGSGTPS